MFFPDKPGMCCCQNDTQKQKQKQSKGLERKPASLQMNYSIAEQSKASKSSMDNSCHAECGQCRQSIHC